MSERGPEGRKLQVTGGSTFVVSLPKRWVQRARLRAGDLVFLSEAPGNALLLRAGAPIRTGGRLTLKADAGGAGEKLLRELIGAYIAGAVAVEIQFTPEAVGQVRKTVRDFRRLVIGPEILEEGRDSIVIQDLSDTEELSPERCLRRIHLIGAAMHRDAIHALLTGDVALASDVVARDEDVDRLFWMVAKQFSLNLAGGAASGGGALHLRLAAKSLERVADHAARIAEHASGLAGKRPRREIGEALRRASEAALEVLDGAFAALVAADLDRANGAITAKRALDRQLAGIGPQVQALRGPELIHYAAIVESLSRTADYATDVAETAINHVIMRRLAP